jgi:hypothetical protein
MPGGLAAAVSGTDLASETISGGSPTRTLSGGELSPNSANAHGAALAGGQLGSQQAGGLGGGGLATSAAAPFCCFF